MTDWLIGSRRLAVAGAAALAMCAGGTSALAATGPGASAMPAVSATGWTAQRLPMPPGAAQNTFTPQAISCSSDTRCAGGGTYDDLSSESHLAALLAWSGGKWTAVQAPLPPYARTVGQFAGVPAISCSSAGRCLAGGYYRTVESDGAGMLLTRSASKWSAGQVPAVPSGSTSTSVTGMSCPSSISCTAVGDYSPSSGSEHGLLLRWSGKWWTATRAPVPASGEIVQLNAVSCPAVTRCIAVGSQQPFAGSLRPLLLARSGGTWKVVSVSLPHGAAAAPDAYLDAVSCPAVARCVAVGSYTDSSGDRQGMLLSWSGKSWTARQAPLPAGAAASPSVSLNAVSCPDSSRCTAGGSYENSAAAPLGLLLTWSGTAWTAASAPAAAYSVQALSCPSATRCLALSNGLGRPVLLTGP